MHVQRLPGPSFSQWEWQESGLCRGADEHLFIGPDREGAALRHRREAQATLICRRCPVLDECREHALTVREPHGVWGGMGERDREALILRRTTPPAGDRQPTE